jgi:hypothetical protein
MQNILDIQNDLKNTSDEHLVQLMQMPEPNFPQYLVLSEMDRRKEMRESYDAAQASQPTVAQQLTQETANSGVTQGLGSLDAGSVRGAEMISNATDMPVIYGNRPIRSMANGGRTGYQTGGSVSLEEKEAVDASFGELAQKYGVQGLQAIGALNKDGTINYLGAGLALASINPLFRIGRWGWGLGKAGLQKYAPGALKYAQSKFTVPGLVPRTATRVNTGQPLGGAAKSLGFTDDVAQKVNVAGRAFSPSRTAQTFGTVALPAALLHKGSMTAQEQYQQEQEQEQGDPYTPYMPPSDTIVEEKEEVVDTQETGRKEDINTALISLARIASAKPNELGNILASAGKDVAASKRERRRDELTERLTEAQIKAYEAKEGDVYQKAFFAAISAGDAFDKLSMDKKLRYSSSGKLETDEEVAEARENYIKALLQPQGLLEAYFTVSTQGSYGGGAGKTTSYQDYLSS